MAKQFFTEHDIEDMAARGQFSLTMSDDVVLTELAFEKAEKLGVKLVQPHVLPPASPVRPYLSEPVKPASDCKTCSDSSPVTQTSDLRQRIRDAVKAKLGNKVDGPLLETIITRVLNNVGVAE
ncbi:hypothetical protein JR338_00385 [Chloroflexota bacterium]|nr:hypothetical protein JR338_00385 [Chloroflexota bacterium]